ncbi:MAG: hypothetical protein ACOYOD_04515 [Saprospiraceae bacterium]|jgi:hypothetical protein
MCTRINVWSSPRNVSTAFMYAFAQRPDTTVVDEPLYAHYLSKTDSETRHPGTEKVLAAQSTDGERVVAEVILGDCATPVVLFKQMTHHLIHLDWSFMRQTKNVMLVRDPRAIIASYAKVIPNPGIQDVGVALQSQLFAYLRENDCLSAVVDAAELLKDPPGVLRQLCGALAIDYTDAMLRWPAGPKPYDGVWAPYWYEQVRGSTGFQPYEPAPYALPPHLEALSAQCMPHYEHLYTFAIKAFS